MTLQDWNIDRGLLYGTLVLVAFGLVMVLNASSPISMLRFHSPHFLFYRQMLWTLAGIAALFAAIQFPLRILRHGWVYAVLLPLTCLLLAVVFTQDPINGTYRWIHAYRISFQPSELAKIVTILFISWYLARIDDLRQRPLLHLARIMALMLPMLFLILREPDMGSVVILLLLVALYLFLAGFPLRLLLTGAAILIPTGIALIWASGYQRQRILTFLDPSADPQGSGYHILQSLIALGHSGFWGLGLGQSTQKLFFLPEPHTDFIYAVVAEELGFLGCAFISGLFLFLFIRGLGIAYNSPVPFNRWLGTGIISLIMVQALINTSMVVNLGPTKGIPLPFISMGGSSLVMNMIMMGLLINISREVPE